MFQPAPPPPISLLRMKFVVLRAAREETDRRAGKKKDFLPPIVQYIGNRTHYLFFSFSLERLLRAGLAKHV